MRVYYELLLWEDVDQNDTDKLKGKFMEMGKRFQSYGVLEFKMRAAQTEDQPKVDKAAQAAQEQMQQQEEDVEYVDEQGNPVTPTQDDDIVDE